MRAISKGREPASLTAHRKTSHCDYDNYSAKDDLRRTLVTEQKGLCCYCMGRIYAEGSLMKIEHWKCQAHHSGEQLNYQNLLGACLGRQGPREHQHHCDTRKGKRDLKWNPADRMHHIETRIRYELDGSIHADDADFNGQLTDVLNLNLPKLKNNRKGVLRAVLAWWKHEKARLGGAVPRHRVVLQRDKHVADGDKLTPYCQVAAWWLDQKLASMTP